MIEQEQGVASAANAGRLETVKGQKIQAGKNAEVAASAAQAPCRALLFGK